MPQPVSFAKPGGRVGEGKSVGGEEEDVRMEE